MTAPRTPVPLQLPDSARCPRCGAGLRCGMVSGDAACWCFKAPHVMPVPAPDGVENAACMCPECLRQSIAAR